MGKAAADMWKVMKSSDKGGSGKESTGGISGDGARINHGRDMDQRGLTGASGSDGSTASGRSSAGGTPASRSSDVMPGVSPFLREVAYSDESAAVSPSLLGAVTSALGAAVDPAVAHMPTSGGGGGGAAPAWAADISPFPDAPTVAFVTNDQDMVDAFKPVAVNNTTHLCAAVVDLTGSPAIPPYAGVNDEEMLYPGSLVKICPMYAAFALRAQVRAFVDAAKANGAQVTLPGVASEIERAWKPKLQALFRGRPEKGFGSSQVATFPTLDEIFTFAPDGQVEFATAGLTTAQIDAIGEFGAPQGKFHDWMRSMLRWSNNAAAGRCILALGYFYINGALADAELFDTGGKSGLWVSADYLGHDWVKTAAEKASNSGGQSLTARWATAQARQKSNFTGTAAQVARLMTMLAQGRLVDAGASQEMRTLMDAANGGIGSYAESALIAATRAPTSIVSKIGFGNDSFSHDCAIVERTVAGKQLRYVAVGLGSAPSENRQDLNGLFVRLDEAIVKRNS
jgi:hypothetical protein